MNHATRWEVTVLGAEPILFASIESAMETCDCLPKIPEIVYKPVPFTRGRLAYRTIVYRTLALSLRPIRVELEDCREGTQ